jgi:hypothetical protein
VADRVRYRVSGDNAVLRSVEEAERLSSKDVGKVETFAAPAKAAAVLILAKEADLARGSRTGRTTSGTRHRRGAEQGHARDRPPGGARHCRRAAVDRLRRRDPAMAGTCGPGVADKPAGH